MSQIRRRRFLLASGALLAAPIVLAQPIEKKHRVGFIATSASPADISGSEPTFPSLRALVRELRALGYVEGKNLILDRETAEGRPERLPEILSAMLLRKPDVIVTPGSQITAAAKKATSTVPIVMSGTAQPVKYGLVMSLARPGGNVTGLAADVTPETEAKRLGLLKELIPKLSRISYLATKWVWEGPYGQVARQAAPVFGVELIYAEHRPTDLKGTFADIARQRPDALWVALSPEAYSQSRQIAELALGAHLPGIFAFSETVDAGGLMSYSWNIPDLYRRAASYVDRILKGAKPSDLPVEQPSTYELVINLKTAKMLGITIPQSMLLRADRIVE